MWNKLTDNETLKKLGSDILTNLPKEFAFELVRKLSTKDYSELLYVVVGMGHFRLATTSYEESLSISRPELSISVYEGKLHVGLLSQNRNDTLPSCSGSMNDIVEFIDRFMIKMSRES